MNVKRERWQIVIAGLIIGVIAALLVYFGNPSNMGFCIACFLRDTAGGLGLHRAATVQYIRPEIIGLVLGSFIVALCRKEFSAKGGSAPVTRFVLGFFVKLDGVLVPAIQVVVFILLVAAPAFIFFTEAGGGPGAKHAPILISLAAGLIVGGLAQRTRLCMVGGIRDVVLFREPKLLMGFGAILVSALVCNLILNGVSDATFFHLGFADQPVAHTDGLWNCLGMVLTGFGCVLLGGCPLRQLVLSGEGNAYSAVTVLGLIVGAAFAHNFGLASSAAGPTGAGKIAVVIGLVAVALIGCLNTFKKKA